MKLEVIQYSCQSCRGGLDLTRARISRGKIFAPCCQCGAEAVVREATCMARASIPFEKELGVIRATLGFLREACVGPRKQCSAPAKWLFVEKNPHAFHVFDLKTYCRTHGMYKGGGLNCERASVDEEMDAASERAGIAPGKN